MPLAASIELLHTATLVHDDVIDAAPTRRGRATANSLFDNAVTVMVGDYMFAHAAELVARTGNIEVIRLFARTLMRMATGELHQDMSAYSYSSGTMRVLQPHRRQDGLALRHRGRRAAAMIAGLPVEWSDALASYGENLGMAFQIVDDILDFTGDEEELGKPAGSDLMHGTLTLPSLILIERYPDNNPVQRYFAGRRRSESLRRSLADDPRVRHPRGVLQRRDRLPRPRDQRPRRAARQRPEGVADRHRELGDPAAVLG